MSTPDARADIRAAARKFEEGLSKAQRKKLGQFFTGIPLGRLLAHLALTDDAHSVLDPMAGHGDLLDATAEASLERGIALERLDGIEIGDETADMGRKRLDTVAGAVAHRVISGSAFDPATLEKLPLREYDLVITNPPYVRYQSQNGNGGQGKGSRAGLSAIIDRRLSGVEKAVWTTLAKGYSGLADLSVPALLLAALLVRPGGRLALVVPATWRSRDYADVIRYLFLRCFRLDFVVEDTQPGWFSDALVRTHLIVATRLLPEQVRPPLTERDEWPTTMWMLVSPEAASAESLLGAAFPGDAPEAKCAEWLSTAGGSRPAGIQVRPFDLQEEFASLRLRSARRAWFRALEGLGDATLPLFGAHSPAAAAAADLPEVVRDILGKEFASRRLSTLEREGIRVGQGLRTGCNSFFYVDACGEDTGRYVRVRSSSAYGDREFEVPANAVRPALRRQSELSLVEAGRAPSGRVLDLRLWVLPEDASAVADAASTYRDCREPMPETMPEELARYVRLAATAAIGDRETGKAAPELTAVRTNVRAHRRSAVTPRFWYMVPDFAPRHLPAAFVARVIGEIPWVEMNLADPILIDANFSTFWSADKHWSGSALKALLNSTWCRLLMEALGTPMGGGALKLEAAHMRKLPMPAFSKEAREHLHIEGLTLRRNSFKAGQRVDEIVFEALCAGAPGCHPVRLAMAMANRAETLQRMRQRIAA
jgi:hypothetical protein